MIKSLPSQRLDPVYQRLIGSDKEVIAALNFLPEDDTTLEEFAVSAEALDEFSNNIAHGLK